MVAKTRNFGEIEQRTGERRSGCGPVADKLCEQKHKDYEALVNHRFDAMDRALIERTKELERRLEGLNELRAQVVRDRDQFVKKETYEMRVSYYDRYIEDTRTGHASLVNRVTVMETRSVVWTSILGVAFMVLQIILHFWRPG